MKGMGGLNLGGVGVGLGEGEEGEGRVMVIRLKGTGGGYGLCGLGRCKYQGVFESYESMQKLKSMVSGC